MRIVAKIALFIVTFALTGRTNAVAQTADFHVIPLPKELRGTGGGSFSLTDKALIVYPAGDRVLKRHAQYLADYVAEATGIKLQPTTLAAQRQCIRLVINPHLKGGAEAYHIRVNSDIILLEGGSAAGLFYAIQTLRKALPQGVSREVIIPASEVSDYPRFAWRGAHLDVARHFIPADSVKRYIDLLALHGMNRFHWHLSDDQGWRIEIRKYPLLTKVGSRRAQTVIGNNSGRYDGTPYGGYYTRKEIKDVIQYAADRHITIVPEIDLPGHMQAALAAYPELGCTGGPYKVWEMWGVSEEVLCAGNPKTYDFIDAVLDEIVSLFPSDYIHIGGDECPKVRWKACPKCQAFITAQGLQAKEGHTAEERLQSYVIRHAVDHLKSLGREAIGWDEILEGGLAPGVAVMSWRGVQGGREAAKLGHKVVMTPCEYLYFDYRQSENPDDYREGAAGYLPLERVYGYEPMPDGLTPEQQSCIMGVQANCWTEYIHTFRKVEFMVLPRMAALSELQWCLPEQRRYADFLTRLPRMIDFYRRHDYRYCKAVYDVRLSLRPDTVRHAVEATLSTFDDAAVHYTLDGSKVTDSSPVYTAPLWLDTALTLRAAAYRGREATPEVVTTLHFNKATARPIRLMQPPHRNYTFGGATTLTDGLMARSTNFHTGEWIGFCGHDLEAVIDLGRPTAVSRVGLHTCVEKGSWVFDARALVVSGSTDGTTYAELGSETYPAMTAQDPNRIYSHSLTFTPTTVRYLKVLVRSEHDIPAWHPGKGYPGFLFVDEIVVE